MKLKPEFQAEVDKEGRLILPAEIVSRYGLKPGATVQMSAGINGVHVRQPVSHLKKVYFELTNQCNLSCRTCMRNIWDEPQGRMTAQTFERAIESVQSFSPLPTVFFGGFGEPLSHPHIIEMVAKAKAIGAPVELVTNGTLLTRELSLQLIEAGLDVLWVSIDGATAESYVDVRLGAALSEVLANSACFRDTARALSRTPPHIGIVFVAMKRNIADLPAIMRLGRQLGADRFLVTNVLPYTPELRDEVLYSRVLEGLASLPSSWIPHLSLPNIDMSETTREPLYQVISSYQMVNFARAAGGDAHNYCPFIENGSTAICWDGSLSPCLPLMHSHISFSRERKRFSRRCVMGNVAEHSLGDLWSAPDYVALRRRVQAFDFSPCIVCGGCKFSETNEEDCFGNPFPACGGCLWAQGVIQCP
ncbi:MAG: radical SAM protein [Proteobacteria bacterium]|nr:radical SAM protein [Pseudomonadota bacterium]